MHFLATPFPRGSGAPLEVAVSTAWIRSGVGMETYPGTGTRRRKVPRVDSSSLRLYQRASTSTCALAEYSPEGWFARRTRAGGWCLVIPRRGLGACTSTYIIPSTSSRRPLRFPVKSHGGGSGDLDTQSGSKDSPGSRLGDQKHCDTSAFVSRAAPGR